MKLDFSSDNSAISFVEEDFAQNGHSKNNSAEGTETLRAGIKAAQRGDRAEARQLLLRVTETDPSNESAWLWLASISEYPEELLIFLNNVLDINPLNERAVEWAKATKSLLAKTFVQRGIEVNNQNQKQFARQCFMQAIVHDNRNEMAWLWLASVTDADEEKINHFHRVLEIDPDNETARDSIRSTRERMLRTVFEKAENAAADDDRETAEKHLNEVFQMNPQHEQGWFLKARLAESFDEKTACLEKLLAFDPQNETVVEALRNAGHERTQEFFAKANEAANDGNRQQANELLDEVFRLNPNHEDGWILKSRMTDSFEEKIACFEKILEFNPANETAQAGVKLRAMLNGGAAMRAEEKISFPNEEFAEQNLAGEFDGAQSNDEPPVEENSSAAEHLDATGAEENFSEAQEEERESAQMPEEETATVASFEGETVSSTDETQAFTYFPESQENEPAEMFQADSSDENEDFADGENYQQDDLKNVFAELTADKNSFEAEENSLTKTPVENSFGEDQQSYNHSDNYSEFEKPEDVFAVYAENYGVEDFTGNSQSAENFSDYNAAENFASNGVSANDFHAPMPEAEFVAEATDDLPQAELSDKPQGELKACPFCETDNEPQTFVCQSCHSLLTLSDMEMILAYQEADQEILIPAVERMEVEDVKRGLESDELVMLAIGYINLKNLRKGLKTLQRASKLDPNNVLIESQANSLAIRLSEIEEKESIHSSMQKDRTIMVVDDSATVRKLISGKLEKSGHIVITAVDGMDAMAKLNDIVPDLILLDITMPRMDGYQVCKLIRNSDTTKEVPVVMISGKDGFFDKVRGRMAGTTGYITKPFGPETLMKMLDTYLV